MTPLEAFLMTFYPLYMKYLAVFWTVIGIAAIKAYKGIKENLFYNYH